jgi:hypothetical protein
MNMRNLYTKSPEVDEKPNALFKIELVYSRRAYPSPSASPAPLRPSSSGDRTQPASTPFSLKISGFERDSPGTANINCTEGSEGL